MPKYKVYLQVYDPITVEASDRWEAVKKAAFTKNYTGSLTFLHSVASVRKEGVKVGRPPRLPQMEPEEIAEENPKILLKEHLKTMSSKEPKEPPTSPAKRWFQEEGD